MSYACAVPVSLLYVGCRVGYFLHEFTGLCTKINHTQRTKNRVSGALETDLDRDIMYLETKHDSIME